MSKELSAGYLKKKTEKIATVEKKNYSTDVCLWLFMSQMSILFNSHVIIQHMDCIAPLFEFCCESSSTENMTGVTQKRNSHCYLIK